MPTPFSNIYIKANVLFEDSELLSSLTDDEYSELLELFLSKARSVYFKTCKKDLSDIDNTSKQFNQTLSEQEEWIIAECLKYIWVSKQLFKEEKLRDKMTSKDYNASHSPGNLIEKLIMLKNDSKKELKNLIISYTFDDFEGFN
jgi:hypothetical protein